MGVGKGRGRSSREPDAELDPRTLDQDLSRRWMLNQLSHPGTLKWSSSSNVSLFSKGNRKKNPNLLVEHDESVKQGRAGFRHRVVTSWVKMLYKKKLYCQAQDT